LWGPGLDGYRNGRAGIRELVTGAAPPQDTRGVICRRSIAGGGALIGLTVFPRPAVPQRCEEFGFSGTTATAMDAFRSPVLPSLAPLRGIVNSVEPAVGTSPRPQVMGAQAEFEKKKRRRSQPVRQEDTRRIYSTGSSRKAGRARRAGGERSLGRGNQGQSAGKY